jgi:penicillin-insensitive murein DD-endopeptidase
MRQKPVKRQKLSRLMPSVRSNFWRAAVVACTIFAMPAFAQTAADQANMANLTTPAAATAPVNINTMPAKKLFGHEVTPAAMPPHAIGTYALGCMAGAQELPITGPDWQVMRLSRHRNWALPQLNALLERFASDAKQNAGWNGLLVGDMAQPRGGPMLTGHASHQIGLDADVWFTPMPDHVMTAKERETMVPLEMVKDHLHINPDTWTENRAQLIKTVASYPEVGRIFVHPPIKAALCKWATGDRSWLAKVRPLYGHTFHFHIRMNCPPGMKSCKDQWKPAPKDGTGCGEELAYWMGPVPWTPHKRNPNAPPYVPPPPLTLKGLPAECRAVIQAP